MQCWYIWPATGRGMCIERGVTRFECVPWEHGLPGYSTLLAVAGESDRFYIHTYIDRSG